MAPDPAAGASCSSTTGRRPAQVRCRGLSRLQTQLDAQERRWLPDTEAGFTGPLVRGQQLIWLHARVTSRRLEFHSDRSQENCLKATRLVHEGFRLGAGGTCSRYTSEVWVLRSVPRLLPHEDLLWMGLNRRRWGLLEDDVGRNKCTNSTRRTQGFDV